MVAPIRKIRKPKNVWPEVLKHMITSIVAGCTRTQEGGSFIVYDGFVRVRTNACFCVCGGTSKFTSSSLSIWKQSRFEVDIDTQSTKRLANGIEVHSRVPSIENGFHRQRNRHEFARRLEWNRKLVQSELNSSSNVTRRRGTVSRSWSRSEAELKSKRVRKWLPIEFEVNSQVALEWCRSEYESKVDFFYF